MKRINRLSILMLVGLLISIGILFHYYEGIFSYQGISEILFAPMYEGNKIEIFIWMGTFALSSINIYTIYKTLALKKNKNSNRYLMILIFLVIQCLLELSVYYIIFFLNVDILKSEWSIFAWYNMYDSFHLAFYILLVSILSRLLLIILCFKIKDEEIKQTNSDYLVHSIIFLLAYGGIIVSLSFLQTSIIKKEITLNIDLNVDFVFSGQNGYGTVDVTNKETRYSPYQYLHSSDFELWNDKMSIEDIMVYRYKDVAQVEVIDKNNGKLSNGDEGSIQWAKEKNITLSKELNINAISEPVTFKVSGLSTTVFNLESLTNEQQQTLEEKIEEYESGTEFKEKLINQKVEQDKEYEFESVRKIAVISKTNPLDEETDIENIVSLNRDMNYNDYYGRKEGDIENYYIYEVIYNLPTNDEKKYYYLACNIKVICENIDEEYSFDNIELFIYKQKVSTYQLIIEEIVKEFQEYHENEKLVFLKSKETITYEDNGIFPGNWDSNQIKFNDIIIEFPVKVSDFKATGYDIGIGDEHSIAPYEITNDYILEKGEFNKIQVVLQNTSDKNQYPNDCNISSIYLESFYLEDEIIYFPGGFTLNSSASNMRSAYGEPKKVKIINGIVYFTYESDNAELTLSYSGGKLNSYLLEIKENE